jgi:hypothetical protein
MEKKWWVGVGEGGEKYGCCVAARVWDGYLVQVCRAALRTLQGGFEYRHHCINGSHSQVANDITCSENN